MLYLVHHKHVQAVDINTNARSGRDAILRCPQKIPINKHGIILAAVFQFYLILKTLGRVIGVVRLAAAVFQGLKKNNYSKKHLQV